jgi:integrase
MRDGSVTLGAVIDAYMAQYAGRDGTRVHRLAFWSERLGAVTLSDLSDDQVHAELEILAARSARHFAGLDADGKRIYRSNGKPLSPATVNRYAAALSGVITWAIKRRIAPKGYAHPCASIEIRPENTGKTRFLSEDERDRLLVACKASKWPGLYLLVLMALSTGARRGELMGLRWRDIDLVHRVATVERTKNGDGKVMPLIPAVFELLELGKAKGKPDALVFASKRTPTTPYAFDERWAKALEAAKIRGVTFHTLRHSAASFLAKNGATLLEIGDLLGHRNITVTRRYSHLAASHRAALVNRVLGDMR